MDFIKNDKWFPVNSEPKPFTIDDKAGNALLLRGRRIEVIAANIANADTPSNKARDFDFQAALEETSAVSDAVTLVTDSPLHMAATASESPSSSMLYRIPLISSVWMAIPWRWLLNRQLLRKTEFAMSMSCKKPAMKPRTSLIYSSPSSERCTMFSIR